MRTALVVVGAVLLSGCSTLGLGRKAAETAGFTAAEVQPVEIKTQAPAATKTSDLSEEDRQKVNQALADVLDVCRPILSGMDSKAQNQAKWAYILAMSGLVAGSVVAPVLTATSAAGNAGWIAGLSGWAGATNFASQSLSSSGFSGSSEVTTRNAIIEKMTTDIATATDFNASLGQREDAITRIKVDCLVYKVQVPSIPSSGK